MAEAPAEKSGLASGTAVPHAALELRAAGPWISSGAPTFRATVPMAGLMVGMPCFGGMLGAPTLRGLLETQRALLSLDIPLLCLTISNESLVTRARNTLVAHFLASDCSHLLFLDADIGFGADGVLRLLAQDRPVIGGLYRRKRADRVEWAVNWPARDDGAVRRDARTGALEAASLGTGFLLLRRDALLRMMQAFPDARYRPDDDEGPGGAWRDHVFALFDAGLEPGGVYLGEDYRFCARWRSIGGEVWCDPGVLLEHHGQVSFAGDFLGTSVA